MNKSILYYSTNLKAKPVTFHEALLKGLAPDRGLFMPEEIPVLSKEEINAFSNMQYHEIAYIIAKKFFRDDMPDEALKTITKDAYNYENNIRFAGIYPGETDEALR